MDQSAAILFDVIRNERALAEQPACQERRRLSRLASEIARCCRVSLVDQILAWLDGPAIMAAGALR